MLEVVYSILLLVVQYELLDILKFAQKMLLVEIALVLRIKFDPDLTKNLNVSNRTSTNIS